MISFTVQGTTSSNLLLRGKAQPSGLHQECICWPLSSNRSLLMLGTSRFNVLSFPGSCLPSKL